MRAQGIAAGIILLLSAVLLFTRLGHYPLWDDEAVTALAAKSVYRSGDTSAFVDDHNVMAYRSGLLLSGTRERSTPPLPAYLAAPWVGMLGNASWNARLPFALLGLASVALVLLWLRRTHARWTTWLLVTMGFLGNVSFWLYCRQCRYYAPAIFCSILIAYLYLNWSGTRRELVIMSLGCIALLASNYINYLALQICLLTDYLLAGSRRHRLNLRDWLLLLLPQIIIGGIIVWIWNPLATGNREYLVGNSLFQRLELIVLNLRDMNACEYGPGILIAITPMLYLLRRNQPWLLRGPLILFEYVCVISFLSPQTLSRQSVFADVRYLAPLIPLCIAISVVAIGELGRNAILVVLLLGVAAFGSNLLNAAPMLVWPLESTIIQYVRELWHPLPDPYTPAIRWLRDHLKQRESVWVVPDYMTYSLMYHVPAPTYAWQLEPPVPQALRNLPPIHFRQRSPPDYVLVFGPPGQRQWQSVALTAPVKYRRVCVLHAFWRDLYRPELIWHAFQPVLPRPDRGEEIYVYKQESLPASSSPLRAQ